MLVPLLLVVLLVSPGAAAGEGLIREQRVATEVVVDRSESLSATATPGRTLQITGHLESNAGRRGTSRRPVRAVFVGERGLLPLGMATTNRRGAFSITIPADWSYSGEVRVIASMSKGKSPLTGLKERYQAARSSAVAVDVAPRRSGKGQATSFALSTAGLVAFDACRDLTYRINLRHASDGFAEDVERAFAMVYEATGLKFRYAGETGRVPFAKARTKGTSATITIAWADERTVPLLVGDVAGLGGSASRVIDGRVWLHHGGVTLDRDSQIKPGFGPGATVGELLLHEIGHVLGLAHVDDPTQVMQPGRVLDGNDRYQAGYLAGLHQLGAMNGCLARNGKGSSTTSESGLEYTVSS